MIFSQIRSKIKTKNIDTSIAQLKNNIVFINFIQIYFLYPSNTISLSLNRKKLTLITLISQIIYKILSYPIALTKFQQFNNLYMYILLIDLSYCFSNNYINHRTRA